MKFKVGDLIWADTGANPDPSLPKYVRLPGQIFGLPDKYGWWSITLEDYPETTCGYWIAGEAQLSPRKPPDEIKREELGSWDLCPWQPKEVRV